MGSLRELEEIMHVKYLEPCPADNKPLISGTCKLMCPQVHMHTHPQVTPWKTDYEPKF